MPPVFDAPKYNKIDAESSNAGKLGPAAILNQNPFFEMDSRKSKRSMPVPSISIHL
jgi:hypothetical protein